MLDLRRCQMSRAKRNGNGEDCPFADFAFYPNGAAMQPDKFLDEREAYAAALERATACPLDTVKPLKEPRQFRRRNTCPSIPNDQFSRVALPEFDRYPALRT